MDAAAKKRGEAAKAAWLQALDTIGYHVAEIATASRNVNVCLSPGAFGLQDMAAVFGIYSFELDPVSRPFPSSRDAARDVNGHIIGNRVAARNDYLRQCAPILAALAYEAEQHS